MPNIGAPELIIILVIALLILGPGKLPEVGASIGKSIREFRKASSDVQDAVKVDVDTSPLPPSTPAPAAPAAAAEASPPPAAAPATDLPVAPPTPAPAAKATTSSEPTPGTN
jgi:TatA/E family protein of Tat protein translocase